MIGSSSSRFLKQIPPENDDVSSGEQRSRYLLCVLSSNVDGRTPSPFQRDRTTRASEREARCWVYFDISINWVAIGREVSEKEAKARSICSTDRFRRAIFSLTRL